MVSLRSQVIVKDELVRLGLHPLHVEREEADIRETPVEIERHELRQALASVGFELLESRKDILVQRVKNIIIEAVYFSEEPLMYNFSVYLSDRLNHDYTYMSNLFSEQLGITIEKFYICHKIERVKELLLYEGLTLTEIAYRMHYSSLAHLSSQFKKITGLTTTQFKRKNGKDRSSRTNC
jgi:AraC-like DNA-binding protein